jgi:bla regulator protein BlaR1
MNDFLIYSLQTISIQLVFLLVYQVLLKGETFFKWNRIYLIGSVLFSFLIPLFKFTIQTEESQFVQLNEIILSNNLESGINAVSQSAFLQESWFVVLYLIGIAISVFLLILKFLKIFKFIKISHKENFKGTIIYKLQNSNQAFTFLNYIFIGDKNQDFELILKHELIHKNQVHSLDLLAIELFKIPFWFNPLLYVFQNKLAEIHEFEADATSVNYDKKKYYETIINQVFQVENIAFTNNFFNQSLIKKRIVMLQKSKSKKVGMLKYATVIPILLVSIALFSTKGIAQEKKVKNANTEIEEMPFAAIEKIPVFVGCENATQDDARSCFNDKIALHIQEHFAYPEEAAKKNIQGKVSIQFTIDKEGNVVDVLTRGPKNGALLEVEAKRIISLLPKFAPGLQKGKAVKVKYGLPLMFKLNGEKENVKGELLPPPPPPPARTVPVPPKRVKE